MIQEIGNACRETLIGDSRNCGYASLIEINHLHTGRSILTVPCVVEQIMLKAHDRELCLTAEVAVDAAFKIAKTPQVTLQILNLLLASATCALLQYQPWLAIGENCHE